MSTTIDQRVVEMRFDNRNFESNVSTTMSSLEKLKQRLNLTGASKGLDELNHAAKRVDMSGLGSAVQTVHAKFSALEVMGVTALANITNQAVNAGKRLAAAFTIDPIKTGFQEYELKMGSIQTIMASTGESLETVNGYLNELNEYSDKTIYSFSDMTQSIGKFTNAGVKLEDAVLAIKGISNEAAVSGANANQASHAMYNFAQALSTGYVQLLDWKSINNASMDTVEFKNQLIETALACGTLTDNLDGTYKTLTGKTMSATLNWNDTLKEQWLTTEVLINTLGHYANDVRDMTAAEKEAYEEKLRGQGYTEAQIQSIVELGKKAADSAKDVKTFSMMMDTLKESVQSGWAQTWEILFGDFEEAKNMWTGLNNFFSTFIEKTANARNSILQGALGSSNWDKLIDKIEAAGLSVEDFQSALTTTAKENGISLDELIEKHGSLAAAFRSGELSSGIIIRALKRIIGVEEEVTKTTEDLGDIVDRVINNEFGVGEERIKKLTEAGYNYAQVQNLVNEKLGSSVRHYYELSAEQKKNADTLVRLSDEQLKSKGYTDEQIAALRELEKAASESGTSINDLIDNLGQMSGREMIIESFKNIAKYIGDILTPLKEAYNSVFGDTFSTENMSDGLHTLITDFYELTNSLEVTEEEAENFKKVFEGLLSIFKVTGSIASKSVLSGIKLLEAVLNLFGTDILEVAGYIGECITQFANWLDTNTIFMNQIDKLARVIHAVIVGIKGCVDAFLELDAISSAVNEFIGFVKEAFDQLGISIDNLFGGDAKGFDKIIEMINGFFTDMQTAIRELDTSELGSFIIKGLIIGLLTGASGFGIVKVMSRIGLMLINAFKAILGIHSPSRVFMALGGFIVAGLLIGIQNGSDGLLGTIIQLAKDLFGSLISAIPEGFNNVRAAFEQNGGNVLETIKTIFTNIGNFLSKYVGGFFTKVVDVLKKIDLGGVIAIVLGASIIYTINNVVDAVTKLASPLTKVSKVFDAASGVLGAIKERIQGSKFEQGARSMLKIAAAIGILAVSLFVIAAIPKEKLLDSIAVLSFIILAMMGLVALSAKAGSIDVNAGLGKISLTLLGITGSLALMALSLKALASIKAEDSSRVMRMILGLIGGVAAIILSLGILNKQFNDRVVSKVGWAFIKLSVALLLMVGVMKLISKFKPGDLAKGLITIGILEAFFVGIVAACKIAEGGSFANVGGMMLKISLALVLMIAVIKLSGKLKAHEIVKGIGVLAIAAVFFGAIIFLSKYGDAPGENVGKLGTLCLGIAAAMLIMAKAIKVIGALSAKEILKGVATIYAIGILFAGLIWVSKDATTSAKIGLNLLMMSGAMLIMAGLLYIVKELSWPDAGKALAIVSVISILFMGLIHATKRARNISAALKWMVIGIGILTVALIALSFLPTKDLAVATGAITFVLGVFAILVRSMSQLSNVKGIIKPLITLTIIVVILAGIVAGLSLIPNPDAAIKTSAALSLLLVAFSGAISILSKTNADIKNAIPALAQMSLVAIILGTVLGLLASLTTKPEALIPSAGALSILLIAFSGAISILGKTNAGIKNAIPALVQMSLVAIILGTVLGLLASFTTKPESLIPSAIALGILLNALAISMRVLDNVGQISKNTIIAAGVLGATLILLAVAIKVLGDIDPVSAVGNAVALSVLLLAMSACIGILDTFTKSGMNALKGVGLLTLMAVPLFLCSKILASMDGIQNATENAKALVILIGALSLLLIPLTLVGLGGPAALIGIGSLIALIAAIGLLAVGIGALMEKFPSIQKFLDTGLPVLEQLAGSIGRMIGNFAEGITDGFVKMGEDLAAMMESLKKASETAKGIKGGSFDGVKDLMTILADIGKTTVGTSIADIFTLGGTSTEKFGEDVSTFVGAMKTAFDSLDGVKLNTDAMDGIITAAERLSGLQASIEPMDNVIDWFKGRTDLDVFGENVSGFVSSMVKSYDGLDSVKLNTGAMNSIITAAERLSALQSTIEPIEPVIKFFNAFDNSRDDLGAFGGNIAKFVKSMVKAYSNLDGVTLNTGAMDSITAAAERLSALQNTIEPIEPAIDWFTARDDLNAFGANVAKFVSSMVEAYADLDNVNLNTAAMDSITTAADKLSVLQGTINPIEPAIKFFTARSDLGAFGKNVAKFVSSMVEAYADLDNVNLNTAAMDSITTGAEKLSTLQGSIEPIKPVIDFFHARSDLGAFGKNVAKFVSSMVDSYANLDGIKLNTEAMDSIVTASEKLCGLQGSIEPIKPVINFFTSRKDLGAFGTNVASFISSMRTAFDTLEGADLNEAAMESVITVASKLAGLQKDLDSMGGVITWFTGRKDLGEFGNNIALFATAMGTLKTQMGENGITEEVITSVTNAGTAIIELQKALPTEGWFDGKMDLKDFSKYITDFADALGTFAAKAAGLDQSAVDMAISTAYRVKFLINSVKDIDTSGVANFTGVGTGGIGADGPAAKIAKAIAAFGKEVANIDTNAVSVSVSAAETLKRLISGLVNLDTSGVDKFNPIGIGEQIKNYSDKVNGINVVAVSASVSAAQKLKSLIAGLVGLDTSGVKLFGSINTIGTQLITYSNRISGIDSEKLQASIANIESLTVMIQGMNGVNTSGVDNFKLAIANLAETNVEGIKTAFSSANSEMIKTGVNTIQSIINGMSSKKSALISKVNEIINAAKKAISDKNSTFKSTGLTLMVHLTAGMNSQSTKVKSTVTSSVSNAASGIKSYYDSFYDAGAYLVAGLANGISDNAYKAAQEAAAMAAEAYEAAKEELDINSPSKIFRSLGYSVPEGFAMGIDKMGRLVKVSAVDMANTAISSVSKSIVRIAEAVNSDIDAQPTIRPVLDLSEVKSGAAAISGLFNNPHSIGVAADVGVISTRMNSRNQNGVNGDVVSAIDKLRKDMSNMGNTYYTIDGVTYDDGSSIATAMETIVQTARIARRV